MAQNFQALQAKMSPASRARSEATAERLIQDMALDKLRAARALIQEHLSTILGVDMTSAVKRWFAVVFHLLYPVSLRHRKRRSQSEATVDPADIRGLGPTLRASVGCLPRSRREYARGGVS
jgi:hypothetical protein